MLEYGAPVLTSKMNVELTFCIYYIYIIVQRSVQEMNKFITQVRFHIIWASSNPMSNITLRYFDCDINLLHGVHCPVGDIQILN